jgi:hypothetical protein
MFERWLKTLGSSSPRQDRAQVSSPPAQESKPVQEAHEQPKADAFLEGASEGAKSAYGRIKDDPELLKKFNALPNDAAKKNKLEALAPFVQNPVLPWD